MSAFCKHFHNHFGSLIYQLYQNRNIFSQNWRESTTDKIQFSKNLTLLNDFHFLDTGLQFPLCFLVNVISFKCLKRSKKQFKDVYQIEPSRKLNSIFEVFFIIFVIIISFLFFLFFKIIIFQYIDIYFLVKVVGDEKK